MNYIYWNLFDINYIYLLLSPSLCLCLCLCLSLSLFISFLLWKFVAGYVLILFKSH